MLGLFGKKRKTAVDPRPFYEKASQMFTGEVDHALIHAPAKDGNGRAWYWVTVYAGALSPHLLQSAPAYGTPLGYWTSPGEPWAQVQKNLSALRGGTKEKYQYIDTFNAFSEIRGYAPKRNSGEKVSPEAVWAEAVAQADPALAAYLQRHKEQYIGLVSTLLDALPGSETPATAKSPPRQERISLPPNTQPDSYIRAQLLDRLADAPDRWVNFYLYIEGERPEVGTRQGKLEIMPGREPIVWVRRVKQISPSTWGWHYYKYNNIRGIFAPIKLEYDEALTKWALRRRDRT